MIGADAFFTSHNKQLARFDVPLRDAAVFQFREFAAAGGLMSYGGRYCGRCTGRSAFTSDAFSRARSRPTFRSSGHKVELIINLKTAKALGLTVPLPLIGRADEVIE